MANGAALDLGCSVCWASCGVPAYLGPNARLELPASLRVRSALGVWENIVKLGVGNLSEAWEKIDLLNLPNGAWEILAEHGKVSQKGNLFSLHSAALKHLSTDARQWKCGMPA